MLNKLNLHNIRSISIDEVVEIQDEQGSDFYYRTITFVDKDDADFTITLYTHNEFDDLSIKY